MISKRAGRTAALWSPFVRSLCKTNSVHDYYSIICSDQDIAEMHGSAETVPLESEDMVDYHNKV